MNRITTEIRRSKRGERVSVKPKKREPYGFKRPCSNCPFRTDVTPYLRRERARDIVRSLVRAEFPCHKTTGDDDDPTPQNQRVHCAGALIMLEHAEQPSQMMRIAERLRIYDPRKLDMTSPVFTHPQAFIDAQEPESPVEEEHDTCAVVSQDCEWPAGHMCGGSVMRAEGPPEALPECPGCSRPVCDSCWAEGGEHCIDCEEMRACRNEEEQRRASTGFADRSPRQDHRSEGACDPDRGQDGTP